MFNSFPEIFTFDHYEKDEEGNEIEKKAIPSSLSELENYTGDDDILEHVDNYFQMHWKYPRRKELAKKFIQKIVAEIWQKITLPLFRISFEQIPSEKNQLTLRKIIDLAKRSFQQLQSSNTLEQLMSNVNATLNVVHYGGNLILDHFEDYEMNNEIKQVETLDNYLSAKYLSRLSSREFEDQWKQELLDYIVENYHLEEEELSQNQ
jgi:hypothetical protein